MAATGVLFVGIPKGFFPQQDTGMIAGITEASADVSPGQMAELQRQVIKIIANDPSVANATGYIGPGGPTVTENNGRLFVLLKPPEQRQYSADQVIRQLNDKLQALKGIQVFMQATQDINLASRLSKTQYQYTLTDVNQDELDSWSAKLFAKLKTLPELADVATDQANAARQLKLQIDRDAASRLGIDPAAVANTLYDAFAQRHVAIFTTLNTYYVILEPILRSSSGRTRSIELRVPNGWSLSQFTSVECGVPAGGEPSEPVSVGDTELQSRAGNGGRNGGRRRAEGDSGSPDAAYHRHEFPGQCAGIPVRACQYAAADRCGGDCGLPHPWHAL
jgi:multidrug efflux pump subunit AcrB